MTSSKANYLPKTLPFNTIMLEVSASTYEFRGDANILSLTDLFYCKIQKAFHLRLNTTYSTTCKLFLEIFMSVLSKMNLYKIICGASLKFRFTDPKSMFLQALIYINIGQLLFYLFINLF